LQLIISLKSEAGRPANHAVIKRRRVLRKILRVVGISFGAGLASFADHLGEAHKGGCGLSQPVSLAGARGEPKPKPDYTLLAPPLSAIVVVKAIIRG
jgi:hypothetical protein